MRIKNLVAVSVTSLILTAPAVLAQFSKNTVSSQINSQFPDQTTGQITPATTRAFLNNLLNSYQQYAGLNKQVGATYRIVNSDYGQLVTFNNSGNVAVTLSPANESGFTAFNFYAQNISTGNVVITPQTGTICDAPSLTLANTQSAWIISDGTNYQCMFGLAGTPLATPVTVAQGGTGVTNSNFTGFDNVSGLTTTGFILRKGLASYSTLSQANGLTLGNIAQTAQFTTICNPSNSNQNWLACTAGQMSLTLCTPTRINVTTALNTTVTTPLCNGALPTYMEFELVGAGGGGAGSATTPGAAGAGTATCWKTSGTACTTPDFQATGGAAGTAATGASAAGGTATAVCDIKQDGGIGGQSANAASTIGGGGGSSRWGGAGVPQVQFNSAQPGYAAAANSGSGGSGASAAGTAGAGGGGGGGGYCLKALTPANILSSFVVTIGTKGNGGTLGTGGAAGGAGADGAAYIRYFWQ